jgi:hypothetical protein
MFTEEFDVGVEVHIVEILVVEIFDSVQSIVEIPFGNGGLSSCDTAAARKVLK